MRGAVSGGVLLLVAAGEPSSASNRSGEVLLVAGEAEPLVLPLLVVLLLVLMLLQVPGVAAQRGASGGRKRTCTRGSC